MSGSLASLFVDAVFAVPTVSFILAIYFWVRVLGAADPAQARRRAVRWTWFTVLGVAAVVVLWLVLASVVHL